MTDVPKTPEPTASVAPRWLSDAERGVWMRLTAVLELMSARIDAQLRHDSGLTYVEYYALAMLSEEPDRRIQMKVLAARTNSTLPRLSRVITVLEREGFVERLPNASDRRATDVALTDAGFAALVRAAPGHVEAVRELVIDPLADTDLATLTRVMDAWLDQLDPQHVLRRDPSELPGGASTCPGEEA